MRFVFELRFVFSECAGAQDNFLHVAQVSKPAVSQTSKSASLSMHPCKGQKNSVLRPMRFGFSEWLCVQNAFCFLEDGPGPFPAQTFFCGLFRSLHCPTTLLRLLMSSPETKDDARRGSKRISLRALRLCGRFSVFICETQRHLRITLNRTNPKSVIKPARPIPTGCHQYGLRRSSAALDRERISHTLPDIHPPSTGKRHPLSPSDKRAG